MRDLLGGGNEKFLCHKPCLMDDEYFNKNDSNQAEAPETVGGRERKSAKNFTSGQQIC